jgi:hypothetical protein
MKWHPFHRFPEVVTTLVCAGAFFAFAGGAQAAQATLPLNATNVQEALNTPVAQQTAAQQTVLKEDIQSGGHVVTTAGGLSLSPGQTALPALPATAGATQSTAAAGNTCFGGELSTQEYVDNFGITLGTAGTEVGGWCEGPGKNMIVSVNGWFWPNDSPSGLCVVENQTYHDGEGQSDGNGHTQWAHALHVYALGYGVGSACVQSFVLEPALRIEYTGHYDADDDWGF